jgi:hypothetical protein
VARTEKEIWKTFAVIVLHDEELETLDLEEMPIEELKELKERFEDKEDEIDEIIEEKEREKLEELAGSEVSALCSYFICEYCDRLEDTREGMVKHLIDEHRNEVLAKGDNVA